VKINFFLLRYENEEEINEWRNLFAHLIEISLEIASLTGPIVSSSSPEGMLPMELTDSLCYFLCFHFY
jgi:hypothetical protein